MSTARLFAAWSNFGQKIAWRTAAWRQRVLRPWQGHSWPPNDDVSLALPFAVDLEEVKAPARGIGVICHLFYPEMVSELRALLANIPFPINLYISTDTGAKRNALQVAFADWPSGSVEVRITPNRGRDIAPKYITFADAHARHELILFIHGKKSPNADASGGDDWRSLLYETLAGSPAIVRSIVALFALHPEIGIVAPQHHPLIRHLIHWDENFGIARRLAKRFGVRLSRRQLVDFAAGSMFWARPAALQPLLDLKLTHADFPPEHGQLRRTIQHAIERLMFVVVERAGYTWVKVAIPARYPGDATILPITDLTDLDAVLAQTQRRILPPSPSEPPATRNGTPPR